MGQTHLLLSVTLITLSPVPFASAESRASKDEASARASKSPCTHDKSALRCVDYVTNYDGDTVTVDVDGVHPIMGDELDVRLKGVDTPEIRTDDACEKKAAKKAKRFVEKRLEAASRIDLVGIERGKYFRVVADVLVNGDSLSQALLNAGLAVPYDGGKKQDVSWCSVANDGE